MKPEAAVIPQVPMNRSAYDEVVEDSSRDARQREEQALSHGIDLLRKAQARGIESEETKEALVFVRRLWTFLIEDLARAENGLPEALRAQLISIGLWVVKEADAIRSQNAGDLTQMIAVNVAIRDGLK